MGDIWDYKELFKFGVDFEWFGHGFWLLLCVANGYHLAVQQMLLFTVSKCLITNLSSEPVV